ncbi:hypothetical protein BGX30_000448 [Mortierella sp. GBA39]|nr:hypothetical protein BGX30_000448 [Mortierella sp. GBA39]
MATIYRVINKHAPGTPVINWFEELEGTEKKKQRHVSLSILIGIGKNSCPKAKQLLRKFELEETANAAVSTPSIDGLDNNTDHVPVPNNHDTPSYPTAIATIASNSNVGATVSIASAIATDFNIKVSMRTINCPLHDLACYWGTGTRRHLNHDSKANVKYRHEYFRRRLVDLSSRSTRDGQGQKWISRYPVVFLDDSY